MQNDTRASGYFLLLNLPDFKRKMKITSSYLN